MKKTYGIDVNLLTRAQWTGVERYVFELVSRMMKIPLQDGERVFLYTSAKVEALGELPKGWKYRVIRWPFKKGWTHGRLSLELLVRPPRVFFTPGHEIPLLYRRVKLVTTVHDIAFLMRPDVYSEGENRRQLWAVRRAVREARVILTPSQQTADDLAAKAGELVRGKALPKTVVTPLAGFGHAQKGGNQVLKKLGLRKHGYVLYLGRIERKKNVEMIVRAFLDGDFGEKRLVLAGKMGFGGEVVQDLAQSSEGRVVLAGFVTDSEVSALYRNALAFVFPTHYEGFGMPVLEAMEQGVPVIASDLPVIREVGGDAVIYCDPVNPKSWIFAIKNLMDHKDFGRDLVASGKARAKEFSWERCAEATFAEIRALV